MKISEKSILDENTQQFFWRKGIWAKRRKKRREGRDRADEWAKACQIQTGAFKNRTVLRSPGNIWIRVRVPLGVARIWLLVLLDSRSWSSCFSALHTVLFRTNIIHEQKQCAQPLCVYYWISGKSRALVLLGSDKKENAFRVNLWSNGKWKFHLRVPLK